MAPSLLALLATAMIAHAPTSGQRSEARGERGCIEGRHSAGRVERLPGVAASTARPRNPDADTEVHCERYDRRDRPGPDRQRQERSR